VEKGQLPARWGADRALIARIAAVLTAGAFYIGAILVISPWEVARWTWFAALIAGGLAIGLATRNRPILRVYLFVLLLIAAFFGARFVGTLREPPESGRLQPVVAYVPTTVSTLRV
jgi:hypothetical protein